MGISATIIKRFFIIVSLFAVTGCNSISLTYQPTLLHFSTPEVAGKRWAGHAEFQNEAGLPEYTFATISPSTLDTYTSVKKVINLNHM